MNQLRRLQQTRGKCERCGEECEGYQCSSCIRLTAQSLVAYHEVRRMDFLEFQADLAGYRYET
jgi:hypothetical protein